MERELDKRTVPGEKAIPSEQKSVDLEHLSHWLDKYDGKYAIGACSCRRSRRVRDEGCGHLEEDICITVGDMATYAIETNKARPATREEVMEILQRAEENGFVHQITNIDGEDKIHGICNCCVCPCYALRTSQLFNTPNMSASAYRAHVDPEKCVACGQCAEVCPAGAAKLGQKLCTKEGPIVYPKQVLPDETKWGSEMWNENYRDDNPSANCYDTGTAPCKSNCPAHIAVQGYIRMAAEGRYMDTLKLIKKENPFHAVCGHICDGLTLQTAQPDIFVGGDVATGPKFAIDAIAAGKEAAFPAPLRARGPEPDDRPQPPRVSRAGHAQCCPADGVLRHAGTAGARSALRRGSVQEVPRPALHVHGKAGQKGGVPLPWLRCEHRRYQPLHRLRRVHDQMRV